MHLANVCAVMARDRGIVQVIYHMTRHVTTRDIESTCVLLLVRDKRNSLEDSRTDKSTHCIRVLSKYDRLPLMGCTRTL